MRYLIMIIITALTFSGVANAAMLCCLEKNEAADTIANKSPNDAGMPCHQATHDNSNDKIQDSHSDQHCECQYCVQNAALLNTTHVMSASASTSLPRNGDTLTILVPRSIYHPPKPRV